MDSEHVTVGNIGERIVDDFLHSKGYSVYCPQRTGQAHPFDRVAFRLQNGRFSHYVIEVKTKPHRAAYPDTGFDTRHYKLYQGVLATLPVWVFWVDESLASVYGNDLTVLMKPCIVGHNGKTLHYPLDLGGIVYFPLSSMRTIATLTPDQCEALRQHARSNFRPTP